MAERQFKTYFFHVTWGDIPVSFHQMLLEIGNIPLAHRARSIMGSPVRLHTLDTSQAAQGLLLGDLERVQMDNLPRKSKQREESVELELEDDEGLGHSTAFVYDARQKILALQANINGVGSSRFAEYVLSILAAEYPGLPLQFRIVMLPESNANLAFQADAEFRKISFTVTDPNAVANTLEHLGPNHPIISGMIKSATEGVPGARLTVTLSAAHSPVDLRRPDLTRMLRLFSRARDSGMHIEKLIAKGSFAGEDQELSFLPHKLCFADSITTTRQSIPFRTRVGMILNARRQCAVKLNEIFPRDGTRITL